MLTPQQFIQKWKGHALTERAAAQSHFLDLCALLGHPDPVSTDPTGERFTFEKRVVKIGGTNGFADVWKRDFFAWEYKKQRSNLNDALAQLVQYAAELENPPLQVACDTDRFLIRTAWTNTTSEIIPLMLDDLVDPVKLDILRSVFFYPEKLRPKETHPPIGWPTVHITGLPETGYERLVGRDVELQRLDDAWADGNINILSLVAEGGAGKSALVNEWLKNLRTGNYRGAEAVLGWSFYSQGTKERATAADAFLNWALDKLGVRVDQTSATAKGDAIAETLAQRRVLLVLDGVEPLQHGPGVQQGQLKDLGLRALLRRFLMTPLGGRHGLVVLTSRLAVKDIVRWTESAAPVLDVGQLSDEAGAALLHDNDVRGSESELRAASRAFGGHPLALSLLASFLKETQNGDVRRRDHIRELLDDPENPRHDHAKRVMESYEKEWLASQPIALAIMQMVGLFDRPASTDCLGALRQEPAIRGLTEAIVNCSEMEWQRTVARLRDVRLLAPPDQETPDMLDAHPLVREWFGLRLERANPDAWRAAHGRLYEHLRDTTQEGDTPTLKDLAPLYQAIPHGCRAGRYKETLEGVYIERICRWNPITGIEFQPFMKLGTVGEDLAAITWFFEHPYDTPVDTLTEAARCWLLGQAGFYLRSQGRLKEALPAMRSALGMAVALEDWENAAIAAINLSGTEELIGEVAAVVASAEQSVEYGSRTYVEGLLTSGCTTHANALHTAGRCQEAERLFMEAEDRQKQRFEDPLFYSLSDFQYCDLFIAKGEWAAARDRGRRTLESVSAENVLADMASGTLTIGRAHLGLALASVMLRSSTTTRDDACAAQVHFRDAIEGIRTSGRLDDIPRGLLARAAFRRSVGDWDGAARDLDEVEEIAEPGPMRLYLCDMALERARLAFARIEAFAPLNWLIDNSPPPPVPPGADEAAKFAQQGRNNVATARDLITRCGYHKRDEELAELEAVRDGRRRFADLPPRV